MNRHFSAEKVPKFVPQGDMEERTAEASHGRALSRAHRLATLETGFDLVPSINIKMIFNIVIVDGTLVKHGFLDQSI